MKYLVISAALFLTFMSSAKADPQFVRCDMVRGLMDLHVEVLREMSIPSTNAPAGGTADHLSQAAANMAAILKTDIDALCPHQ